MVDKRLAGPVDEHPLLGVCGLPIAPVTQEPFPLEFHVCRIELFLDFRQVAFLAQEKFRAEGAIAFLVRLSPRRVPAGGQQGIERFGNGFAQPVVKRQVDLAHMPAEVIRQKPRRRPDVVRVGDLPLAQRLPPDDHLPKDGGDKALGEIAASSPGTPRLQCR